MDVYQAGSRPKKPGPKEYFSGTVSVEPIIAAANAPSRVMAASVAFDPGARTAWHTHPLGQTLYVVSGVGLVQTKGEPIREIRVGDTVWIPPGEKHWHGAAPTTAMTHIAVHESLDGSAVTWLEHVTDEQYAGKAGS